MKNNTKNLASIIVIFLLSGILFPVHAIDGASHSALINKSEEIIRSKGDEADFYKSKSSLKHTTPVAQESESAAHLSSHNRPQADTRVERLKAYLIAKNSPLVGEAAHFVEQADLHNLDWKFVAAISGVESTFGKFIPPGSYNGWGWGIPTGAQSGIQFNNWEDAIAEVSKGLHLNYINRGAVTIEQIGRIYAASPKWSMKVRFFMDQIENFTPNSPDLLAVTL